MKKTLMTLGLVIAATGSALAAGTAQITFGMTRDLFFEDGAPTWANPTDAGWYAEIILQAANTAYVEGNFASYLIAAPQLGETGVGVYGSGAGFHETGKNATGGAISAGRSQIIWQYTTTTDYYATWRVYNAAAKTDASKYLVVPTWKLITLDPNEPTSSLNVNWSSTADRANIKYDNPLYSVPEPTTMALFGLGGLALVIRRKMRKDA
jgi:hypothetical protein